MPYHILILGALSGVGRDTVAKLVADPTVDGTIRAVDRSIIQGAFLSLAHTAAFARVEFVQANMRSQEAVAKVFSLPDGEEFTSVIDCSAHALQWEVDEVYRQRFLAQPLLVAGQVVARGIGAYILLSSSRFFYGDGSEKMDESAAFSVGSRTSRYTKEMEEAVRAIPDLPLILLRPAVMYGADRESPLVTVWMSGELHSRGNVPWPAPVHNTFKFSMIAIPDVSRAIIHMSRWYLSRKMTSQVIYNLAGNQDTNAGDILCGIRIHFPELEFTFTEKSKVVVPTVEQALAIQEVKSARLQEHWLLLLEANGLHNSPFIPNFDVDYLLLRDLSIDGSAITRDTGFVYEHAGFDIDMYKGVFQEYMDNGWWPRRILGQPAPSRYA